MLPMKNLFRCVGLFAFCMSGFCQTATPYLGLTLPPHGAQNYDVPVNANFTKIDTAVGALQNAFQGVWSSSTTYSKNQEVTYLSALYISLVNTNLNNIPSSSPLQWQL